jgi:long-chain fatty acid transport protein
MPDVKASVTGAMGQGKIKGNSEDEVYAIPAFGVSVPITDGLSPPDWRFGLAAFGVTGLGVDYRESNLDQPTFFPFTMAGAPADGPLITGEYTALQSMRFAPAFGFQPNAKVSFGLAGIIEYSNLDLGNGSDWDYGFGVQGGAIFRPWFEHHITLGIGYEFTQAFSVNLGYMHAFKNTLSETGTDPFGNSVKLKSELAENAIDLGLTWRF